MVETVGIEPTQGSHRESARGLRECPINQRSLLLRSRTSERRRACRYGSMRRALIMSNLDSQQIESLGRAALTAALVADDLEVARPERDSGIDRLAFTTETWKVVPIQMKVATNAVFNVHRKYEHIDQLVMAYVWNARSAERRAGKIRPPLRSLDGSLLGPEQGTE